MPYKVLHLETEFGTACGRSISGLSNESKKYTKNPEKTTCKLCKNTRRFSSAMKINIGKKLRK